MKVLVTGTKGQLGSDIISMWSDLYEIYGYGRDRLDITNEDQCRQVIGTIQPDVIVHCAAYTAVDEAESDSDRAFQINAIGTRNLVVAAERVNARFCYISTDYVFDGTATSPYQEYDNTSPQGVYGKSKRAGEELVKTLSSRYFIVRTSWIYGQYGNNFVKTMLRLAKEKDCLKVVDDQKGSPTYTVDLVRFLEKLIVTERYGVYHATNSGMCTWFEFAFAIFEESGLKVNVVPCTTDEFPRPAPRPKYSVLDHSAIRANGFDDLRSWREGLHEFLNMI